jgi:hypothetical protein
MDKRTLMPMRKILISLLILFAAIPFVSARSQPDSAHLDYIAKWSKTAVEEMYYSKIPASIIMAQALHESRYGTSELAVKANNHFGIKCQSEWYGKRYTYQDDDDNTCFRQYDSPEESFRDHSDFLMKRPRYAFLFDLDPHDYTAWAYGLKKAGYATNPQYAQILIKLIEDYKLYLLDTVQLPAEPMNSIARAHVANPVQKATPPEPAVFHRNRINFVIAAPGDDIASLTKKHHLLRWEIRKYNELPRGKKLVPGQLVYIQPKRRQAEQAYSFHTVEKGETMYSISQVYGIKLKWLYRRNRMKPGTEPRLGQELWLRGMKPETKRSR